MEKFCQCSAGFSIEFGFQWAKLVQWFQHLCFENIFFVVLFTFEYQSVLLKFHSHKFSEDEYNKILSILISCIWRFVFNFVIFFSLGKRTNLTSYVVLSVISLSLLFSYHNSLHRKKIKLFNEFQISHITIFKIIYSVQVSKIFQHTLQTIFYQYKLSEVLAIHFEFYLFNWKTIISVNCNYLFNIRLVFSNTSC